VKVSKVRDGESKEKGRKGSYNALLLLNAREEAVDAVKEIRESVAVKNEVIMTENIVDIRSKRR